MLRDSVLRLWMTEPCEVALPRLVVLFDDGEVEQHTLLLDEEIQCNSWLFGLIKKDIHQYGFTVEPNQQPLRVLGQFL